MKRVITLTTATLIIGFLTLNADDDIQKYSARLSKAPKIYKQECGACHMAYQPEFLPKRSWKKMMQTLEDHFKVDASLDKNDTKQILDYLLKNANDSKRVYGDVGHMGRGIKSNQIPLKISKNPYFIRKHRKIPKRLILQKKVKSIANCTACHTKAQNGNYSEGSIFIPNYGRWDD
jgi:mono/diheme cytochrome c family protein